MDWATLISGALGSAASGGILGFAGGVIGGVAKYFQEKQRQAFEEKKWVHELELQRLEIQRDREEDEHELAVIAQQGAWQGLGQSIQADAAGATVETYRWSKAVKELYRPFLTTALFVLVYFIFQDLMTLFKGGDATLAKVFTPVEAKALITYMVQSVVFTASTAGVWWFGDRAFAPPGTKNR
jgi:hypothetical protein